MSSILSRRCAKTNPPESSGGFSSSHAKAFFNRSNPVVNSVGFPIENPAIPLIHGVLYCFSRYMLQYLEEERSPVSFDGEERRLEPIKHALSYIQLHYQEPITLQNLADAAGYSSYYFCKLFKKTTQLTPLQYVVRYRLEQAKKLLLTTNDPAETIMLNAGFRNYGYFWRTFKEIYGYSPQAYRNHNR